MNNEIRKAPLTKEEAQAYEGLCLIEFKDEPHRLTWIEKKNNMLCNWDRYGVSFRFWAQNSLLRNDYPWED